MRVLILGMLVWALCAACGQSEHERNLAIIEEHQASQQRVAEATMVAATAEAIRATPTATRPPTPTPEPHVRVCVWVGASRHVLDLPIDGESMLVSVKPIIDAIDRPHPYNIAPHVAVAYCD